MKYASVCDGIGAVHVAWQPLGWECAWTSEIEPFPIAVVEQRWGFKNLGDMTQITQGQLDEHGAIELLVGGTPCQSFSVAGLRGGLDDARGNLALRFMQLVGAARPRWVVWENVPGVLSSNRGRDFGAILGALAELGYGFAYRVLDAQYFGLAQRRKRVFVVGCLGNWRRAAAVLFERHSLSGHPAPRREAGPGVAALTARGVGTCGADDNQAQAGHLIAYNSSGRGWWDEASDVAQTLRAQDSITKADTLVPVAFDCKGTDPQPGNVTPTLRSMNYDKSHANAGGQVAVVTPIDMRQASRGERMTNNRDPDKCSGGAPGTGVGEPGDPCPSLSVSHTPAVAFNWQAGGSKAMIGGMHNRADALQASQIPAVAFAQNQRDELRTMRVAGALAAEPGMKQQTYVSQTMGVRRITPREAERLQGFPDDYSLVTYRKKPAADGPRYRALGNSMAVPVMRWIGERLELVDKIREATR